MIITPLILKTSYRFFPNPDTAKEISDNSLFSVLEEKESLYMPQNKTCRIRSIGRFKKIFQVDRPRRILPNVTPGFLQGSGEMPNDDIIPERRIAHIDSIPLRL
jgi:hypothetical protein